MTGGGIDIARGDWGVSGFHTGFFAGGGEVIVKVVVVYVSY